mmetsp:Transcript_40684/g.82093  ORF Transcript_40684/g.82093 Transcript_40684/m.82093 type:complete len:263 (+) Transcript_40684:1660-2448(+)
MTRRERRRGGTISSLLSSLDDRCSFDDGWSLLLVDMLPESGASWARSRMEISSAPTCVSNPCAELRYASLSPFPLRRGLNATASWGVSTSNAEESAAALEAVAAAATAVAGSKGEEFAGGSATRRRWQGRWKQYTSPSFFGLCGYATNTTDKELGSWGHATTTGCAGVNASPSLPVLPGSSVMAPLAKSKEKSATRSLPASFSPQSSRSSKSVPKARAEEEDRASTPPPSDLNGNEEEEEGEGSLLSKNDPEPAGCLQRSAT